MQVGEKLARWALPSIIAIGEEATFFPEEAEVLGEDDRTLVILIMGSLDDGQGFGRAHMVAWLPVDAGSTPEKELFRALNPRPKVRVLIGKEVT